MRNTALALLALAPMVGAQEYRGMLGPMNPALAQGMRTMLIRALLKKMPRDVAEPMLRLLLPAR